MPTSRIRIDPAAGPVSDELQHALRALADEISPIADPFGQAPRKSSKRWILPAALVVALALALLTATWLYLRQDAQRANAAVESQAISQLRNDLASAQAAERLAREQLAATQSALRTLREINAPTRWYENLNILTYQNPWWPKR